MMHLSPTADKTTFDQCFNFNPKGRTQFTIGNTKYDPAMVVKLDANYKCVFVQPNSNNACARITDIYTIDIIRYILNHFAVHLYLIECDLCVLTQLFMMPTALTTRNLKSINIESPPTITPDVWKQCMAAIPISVTALRLLRTMNNGIGTFTELDFSILPAQITTLETNLLGFNLTGGFQHDEFNMLEMAKMVTENTSKSLTMLISKTNVNDLRLRECCLSNDCRILAPLSKFKRLEITESVVGDRIPRSVVRDKGGNTLRSPVNINLLRLFYH
jgi:hypothetical protein